MKRKTRPLTLVCGNRGGDADSYVSAAAYAYLRRKVFKEQAFAVYAGGRKVWSLRPELDALQKILPPETAAPVFAEELSDFLSVLSSETGEEAVAESLFLVDHHEPEAELSAYASRVKGIFDHHRDQGLFPRVEPRRIAPRCSSAAWIAEEYLRYDPEGGEGFPALALRAVLTMDRRDHPETPALPEDDKLLKRLEELSSALRDECADSEEQKTIERIYALSRRLPDGIGPEDCLRRDFKKWTSGGFSCGAASLPLSAEEWMQKKNPEEGSLRFAREEELDFLFCLFISETPRFRRELYYLTGGRNISSSSSSFASGAEDRFREKLETSALRLRPVPGHERLYRMEGQGCSRKELQPILRMIFKELEEEGYA